MKKFIKNCSLFLLLFALLCGLLVGFDLFIAKNQYSQNYQASLQDKLSRLASLEGPKIILVGNSNLAFGIDSQKIEEALGMPVVNMGQHGGLGDKYYEELVKPYIQEGDIVILAPTQYYGTGEFDDKSLALITLEKNRSLWEPLSTKEKLSLLPAYPYYVYSCATRWLTGAGNQTQNTSYSRAAFNEYGDVFFKPESEAVSSEELFGYPGAIPFPKVNSDFVDRINAYNEYVTGKGAQLVMVSYPIAQTAYTRSKEDYAALQSSLEAQLDCPFLSDYSDYFLDPEYFYDTIYHLTEEGTALRTQQLISDLEDYLNRNP